MSSDINIYRKPLVSPLRDFICVLNPFAQLPLWATLSRASGTFDNTKLEYHLGHSSLEIVYINMYTGIEMQSELNGAFSGCHLCLARISKEIYERHCHADEGDQAN